MAATVMMASPTLPATALAISAAGVRLPPSAESASTPTAPHHGPGTDHVDEEHRDECQQHAQRQIAVRVLHLLRDRGHVGEPHVRNDHQPHGGEERRRAHVEGAVEGAGVQRGDARTDHPAQHGQEYHGQDHLQDTGLLGAEEVDRAEAQREGEGNRAGGRLGEVDPQVGAEVHQCEGRLEGQRGPGAESADRPHVLAPCCGPGSSRCHRPAAWRSTARPC